MSPVVAHGQTQGQGQGRTEASSFTAIRATCFNMVVNENGSQAPDLFARCGEIVGSRDTEASLIVGRDELGAAGRHATEAAVSQAVNVAARMAAVRSGASGVSVAALGAVGEDGWTLPAGTVLAQLADARGGGASADGSERWGFFLNGDYAFGDRDPGAEDVGFDFENLGGTLGFDYRFSDRVFGGLALGFWQGDNDLEGGGGVAGNGQGSLDVEGESLTLYASFGLSEAWYLDGSLTVGSNDYDSTTIVNYNIGAQVDQVAEGDTEGDLSSGSLALGRDYVKGAFSLQTVLRGNYSKIDIDGYTETFSNPGGAGSELRLQVLDQEIESLTADLEFNFAWTQSRDWGVFIPQLRAGWSHEFEDDARQVVTRLADDPNFSNRVIVPGEGNPLGLPPGVAISKDLVVFTDEPDRDFFVAGAGFSAVFKNGKQAFVVWDTILGRGDLTYNSFTAGFRLGF